VGQQILVIGLGSFGGLIARELASYGHEVLGCDRDPAIVAAMAPDLTDAVELDATDETALRAVGPQDFDVAIVAVDRPTTILATMLLEQLGVRSIVARAATALDAEILARVGADRVLRTDELVATWVARTIDLSGALDFIRLADGVAAVHLRIPQRVVGQTVGGVVAARPGLSLVALHRGDQVITDPAPDTVLVEGDAALLVGPEETFRSLTG
jgi:trk system potassium uptake protein TrkA